MKGSKYFGGEYDKLRHLTELNWDVLVIDEAHEGVDTYKTDLAFDRIRRKFTLHLSGTPFKALANDKFAGDAIFNWTYADEQAAKRNWQGAPGQQNPYANLPMLNLYTCQMSEIIRDEIQQGVEIDGETQEFAFDLNEFFKVKSGGSFEHEAEVDRFLDAMTTQNKFPFSTPELRAELKHTFWLLNRVDSARALAKKLQAHPVFRDYEVILAAGDGKLDDTDENQKSFDRVKAAIAHHEKTITLSVGQLTTGVTIPEWSAVLMLSNLKSPALYMQAAFRAQNPCLFHENGTFRRKENAYVFDFDPARTLLIYERFANDLSQDTASGKGDTEERKAHIQNLLNFFPVIGEDEEGEMVPLDAEKVLSIPRKIKSKEVVRMGFQSNFLFQNISNVFSAPQEVLDILQNFQPISEAKAKPIQIGDRRRPLPERQGRGGFGRGLRHRQGGRCVRGEDLRKYPGTGHRPARPDRCPGSCQRRASGTSEKEHHQGDHHSYGGAGKAGVWAGPEAVRPEAVRERRQSQDGRGGEQGGGQLPHRPEPAGDPAHPAAAKLHHCPAAPAGEPGI